MMFSAGASFGAAKPAFGVPAQPIQQPAPQQFLIGSGVQQFRADKLQQINDQLLSGYQDSGQQQFVTNFYLYQDKQQATATPATSFGGGGFGTFGKSAAAPVAGSSQITYNQANNYAIDKLSPQEYRGFAGIQQKLNQSAEDTKKVEALMKIIEDKLEVATKNQQEIFNEIEEQQQVQLALKVQFLQNQENEQSFQYGFSISLENFYSRLNQIQDTIRNVNISAVKNFQIDESIVQEVQKLGVMIGKLFE